MLKRVQIAMLINLADHKIAKFLVFVAIISILSRCDAIAPHSAMDICYLLKNMNKFDKETVEIRSELKFTMHGRYLFGSQCPELGTLGLTIEEKRYEDKNMVKFVRKVLSQSGEAQVTLVGRFIHAPSKNYLGDFVVNDVIEIKR